MKSGFRNGITVFQTLLAASIITGAATAGAYAADIVFLDQLSHIHAIAVDKAHPSLLYVATHHGLFSASPNGAAARISREPHDLMAFAAHPTDPKVFYASGHPPGGGNLGVIRSDDGGRTWSRLAKGVNGPVDFHAMAVSRTDPNVIYGTHRGLQVSRDAGRSWELVAALPGRVFDLAVSARDANIVYAAARNGLFVSRDGGRTWETGYLRRNPATMVHVSAGGRLYAFIYGVGLITAEEPALSWQLVSDAFDDRVLFKLDTDPADSGRLYGVADTGAVMTSRDGGKTWTNYTGSDIVSPQTVARGRRLYEDTCQSCHGVRGVGERPNDMYAKDEYGFVAPPLDNSAHGWHHSDRGLVATILNGSPRNARMLAWKQVLTRKDAEDLVAYIKSLWSFRSLACQGVRHMKCM